MNKYRRKTHYLISVITLLTGPILIAQGALDPLNDARSRAASFAQIRSGIKTDLLELGHCPMDEDPTTVSYYTVIPCYCLTWMSKLLGGIKY